MRTFCFTTLGCKVNHYETEQVAALLQARGLRQVQDPTLADIRIVNTCSVTVQAASKSRQAVRHLVRLPVLHNSHPVGHDQPFQPAFARQRTIVMGCWATSDTSEASNLPGVSAVLGHHNDIAGELDRLLSLWHSEDHEPPAQPTTANSLTGRPRGESRDNGWINQVSTPACPAVNNKPRNPLPVNRNLAVSSTNNSPANSPSASASRKDLQDSPAPVSTPAGTFALPQLHLRQSAHQRAFLKVQDGCDAHCTYCIIPKLRSRLWSRPIDAVVAEARQLVSTGHLELVLTGIFLGAYGQPTALRRRQPHTSPPPLAHLVNALCTSVPGLRRLRLSSIEPGDLTDDFLSVLRAHPQVVPHFHIPLQSGSDLLLRRMNRQYRRDDFLRMVDRLHAAFDRPALTTDIIVGFPGETDPEFAHTLDIVHRTRFIHIHAFPFSPRPNTAAARWTRDFIRGPILNDRINLLRQLSEQHSLAYRQQFLGDTVEVLVERPNATDQTDPALEGLQHGRTPRYFSIHFPHPTPLTGQSAQVRLTQVTPTHTMGTLCSPT